MIQKQVGSSIIKLKLSEITLDSEIQPRQQLNQEVIAEYAEAMRQGAKFPPVIVFYDGIDFWLADGFHRIAAKSANSDLEILTKRKSGSRRDAILFAAGANSTHGFQRTNADKRRVVQWLLSDNEWSTWSDNEIARQTNVSQPFVSKLRKALSSYNSYKRKGVDSAQRLIRRNGRVQTMNISNIGGKAGTTQEYSPKEIANNIRQ